MPEIVEKAEALATRKIGPLPAIAWVGIGVGGFVVFHLLTGGSGADSASPSTPVPSGFDAGGIDGGGSTGGAGDGAGGTGSGGGSGTTAPPTPGSTVQQFKLSLTGSTPLYSASGKLTGSGSSGTYVATKVRVLGLDFYRFTRSGHTTLVRTNAPHIKVT